VALLCNAGQLNTEDLGPQIVGALLPPGGADKKDATRLRAASPSLAGQYRNVASARTVDVAVTNGRARFNNGVPFGSVGRDQLRSVDGAREAFVERGAGGEIVRVRVTRVGNSTLTLEPMPSWHPEPGTINEVQGAFHSADADAAWVFAVRNGELAALGPRGMEFSLQPIYRDAFSARDADWIVTFERGADGRVARARFFKTRTRGVAFEIAR
jgi:hypothetical protein